MNRLMEIKSTDEPHQKHLREIRGAEEVKVEEPTE